MAGIATGAAIAGVSIGVLCMREGAATADTLDAGMLDAITAETVVASGGVTDDDDVNTNELDVLTVTRGVTFDVLLTE